MGDRDLLNDPDTIAADYANSKRMRRLSYPKVLTCLDRARKAYETDLEVLPDDDKKEQLLKADLFFIEVYEIRLRQWDQRKFG